MTVDRARARVLFVGDGWMGSNARSMADGFRAAGCDVVLVDTTPVSRPARYRPHWVYSKVAGRRHPGSVDRVHERVEAVVARFRPDLLVCFKTIHLDQERLLAAAAGIPAVHYSPDDVSNPENVTPAYLRSEQRWDLVVTTKRHNVPELRARGARDVLFVLSAYDPAWHRPMARRDVAGYDVGFIGNLRPDRETLMGDLAERYGRSMVVLGPGWSRSRRVVASPAHVGAGVYGEELSVAISSILANLVLLNSDNRDTHTYRTFEVPAAGGLFVGERTEEHAALIEDRREGFLFGSEEELLSVLDEIRGDRAAAAAVAERGHRAITGGHHTQADRAAEILAHLGR